MKYPALLLSIAILICGSAFAASAAGISSDRSQSSQLQAAQGFLRSSNPQAAIRELDAIIAHFERLYEKETRRIYCTRSKEEVLAYMIEAAAHHIEAVALNSEWSTAYFLKAYALADLGQFSLSERTLDSALRLSPYNATFLSEKGFLAEKKKLWQNALEVFTRAEACANAYSPQEVKTSEITKALRGQGYCLVELGKLDEAEKVYQKSLLTDPGDRQAAAELKYIAKLRTQARK